jgi:hypothetical protein
LTACSRTRQKWGSCSASSSRSRQRMQHCRRPTQPCRCACYNTLVITSA